MERRARTRRLIEAGSLVEQSGLLDLFNDDRDALLGAYLELSQIVRNDNGANALAIWKRRGQQYREVGVEAGGISEESPAGPPAAVLLV